MSTPTIKVWRGPVTKYLYIWELQEDRWVLVEVQGRKQVVNENRS